MNNSIKYMKLFITLEMAKYLIFGLLINFKQKNKEKNKK